MSLKRNFLLTDPKRKGCDAGDTEVRQEARNGRMALREKALADGPDTRVQYL